MLSWLGRHQVLLCPLSGRHPTSETLIESLFHSRNSLAFALVTSGCGSWDVWSVYLGMIQALGMQSDPEFHNLGDFQPPPPWTFYGRLKLIGVVIFCPLLAVHLKKKSMATSLEVGGAHFLINERVRTSCHHSWSLPWGNKRRRYKQGEEVKSLVFR